MTIPVDPGTGLTDNTKTPIKVSGTTGLHARFKPLYDMFNGAIGPDNLSAALQADVLGVRKPGDMFNVGFFIGGTGNGSITIKQANGNSFANTDGNRGYIWLRSATDGSIIRGKITSDVTLSPVGAHWGVGTKGDLTSAILRVYAINDGNTTNDFTPKWGLGYQGGFTYIRNTQDSTTATDINLPEEIFVNSGISNDNSPMSDMGHVIANFDDTGNVNGEDFWAFTASYPGVSADGVWQDWIPDETGFSAKPGTNQSKWMMVGKTVFIRYRTLTNGTSNATSFTVKAPIKNHTQQYSSTNYLIYDNSSLLSDLGYLFISSSSVTITLYKSQNIASFWTAAGQKGCLFEISYPAYQP